MKAEQGGKSMSKEFLTKIKSSSNQFTKAEKKVADFVLQNPKKVYTKAQIYSLIWNDAYCGDENAVNVHMSRLRTKIEDNPRTPKYIITVWGIGYKLGEIK